MSHHDAAHHHRTADDEYRETPPGAGHEHTDAEIAPIVKFAVWIVAIAIVTHFGVYYMFEFWAGQRAASQVAEYPLAEMDDTANPRLPNGTWRLQRFPENEIYEYKLQQQHLERTYGWADKAAGRVRIPVEEAMRLALSRGLPSRSAAPAATADATAPAAPVVTEVPGMMPTDSSAGRVMERRRQ